MDTISRPDADVRHEALRIAGKKIEILERDTTGMAPDVAKRLAQELVTRDQVDFLAGFGLTPNAMAVAPVATQAKKAMIIMNAAASVITTKSPYIVRVSMTIPQVSLPMAQWAARNGVKRVYTLVADYAPGLDAETTFKKGFEEGGGQVIDSARVPPTHLDYGPCIPRIKDAKPDAGFLFLPAGEPGIAFMKSFTERGLAQAGISSLATHPGAARTSLVAGKKATWGRPLPSHRPRRAQTATSALNVT